ncbi:TPA: hypothetical protein DEP58_03380 [Patescibacteria group bacterium]|nr:MAG: hypothetical protein UU98_C0029G0014 [Parcubacteria group bacterium GW2011_GWD2_42_14]HCC05322.1 hypothetical protein [Patescibacteria group bacterium]
MTQTAQANAPFAELIGLKKKYSSKEDIKKRNDDINRAQRAMELGLPLGSTWADISAAYAKYESTPDIKQLVKRNGVWVHPLSDETITGALITEDFTVLRATDMFAHPDGTWKKCGINGLKYRNFSRVPWIRPL